MHFLQTVLCTQTYGFDVQLDTAHGKHYLVKMFKHLMISVKIVLCLESQETITELSVHTSTHTHTHCVNNIIYICFWWVLGHILTYLKCDLHKFCRMECSRASWSVCFRHVYRWKIYILITLGAVLFQNDEKMWIKYQILYFCECQQSVKQLLLWFNSYSEIKYECSLSFIHTNLCTFSYNYV